MKRLFSILVFLLPVMATAQSVAINTDNSLPHVSALLDISSTTKGVLIPRVTTAQRTAIAGPAAGLIVYDSDTFSFWYYGTDINSGWLEIQSSLNKYWSQSLGNVFNTNQGNVGIGTNTPAEKLSLNATDPAIQFLNSGVAKGFVQAGGNDMRLGTYFNNTTGDLHLTTRGTDRLTVTDNGRVGIGTNAPAEALSINATTPSIQFIASSDPKGFLRAETNDMRLGTYVNNLTGNVIFATKAVNRMWINEDGLVSIGTSNPTGVLTVNATNPTLQLKNNDVDKGFIQLVNDDIRIGTNLTNTDGRFIVRTNGSDRLWVNENGKVGIGIAPGVAANTPHLTINSNINNDWPKIELRQDNIVHGKLEIAQNAKVDVQLSAIEPTGRVVLRTFNTPFGVVVHPGNDVSIGNTPLATGYSLSVHGKIMCTDLTMQNIGSWPDYVFSDKYPLRKLEELRTFIESNKHLPGVPSEAQIEKEGINMTGITKALLEKVEELTLYVLQLQAQIDELKKK
jgi:hypothetical protein